MVRRTYATRKRRLNLIPVSYITRDWVMNYLKMRQFERFYGGFGRFPVTAYSSSIDVFNFCIGNINALGINAVSCSGNILNRLRIKYDKNFILYDFTLNSRNTQLQFNKVSTILEAEGVFPNVVTYDESGYIYDELTPSNLAQSYNYFDPLSTITHQQTLQIIVNYYRILTLITLYSVHIRG